jgi:dolichol-phosphate mannosyltransferase
MPPILKLAAPDIYRAALLAVFDTALLFVANSLCLPIPTSLPLSFLIATNLLFAFDPALPSTGKINSSGLRSVGYWRFLWLGLLTLFLRGAIWTLLHNTFGDSPGLVIPLTSFLSAALLITSLTFTATSLRGEASSPNRSNLASNPDWTSTAWLIIAYMLLLRILYLGILNVIPEEAYYWNYGQHLDWGYLDHPPMVGWLSRLGTMLLGHNEFGVRLFALVSWCATAWFAYRFAFDRYGKKAALGVVVMLSTLPFFIGVGSLMMPDAPLTACWAGALFFLHRALFSDKANAWYGVGICLGLGLLSKYTMGLLVPVTFIFILWDGKSRHWLTRPQPYLSLVIAALLFSPVIWWNAHHEWISFAFQTTRRWGESIRFSPHLLLGSIIVLLTPAGLWAAAVGLKNQFVTLRQSDSSVGQDRSRSRFVLSCVLVPLAVYTLFSLTHEPKLNWTGPLWLALLPAMAALLYPENEEEQSLRGVRWKPDDVAISPQLRRVERSRDAKRDRDALRARDDSNERFSIDPAKRGLRLRRAWSLTVLALVVTYGAALYWVVMGIPGLQYPKSFTFVVGWSHLSEQVSEVERQVITMTAQQPLIVGMNRYFISSEIAFYSPEDGPSKCAGRHLFGDIALMYRFWFPEDQQAGKNVIVVAESPGELETDAVTTRFDSLGTVQAIPMFHRGKELGNYWYRIGWGYKIIAVH